MIRSYNNIRSCSFIVIHVVVSWVDFPISTQHSITTYTDFWLLNGCHPSLAQPPWPTHAGLWSKPRLLLGRKTTQNHMDTLPGPSKWFLLPKRKMIFQAIINLNLPEHAYETLWNHMKYKQVYLHKMKLTNIEGCWPTQFQEFFVQDAVPIGLPGAWPSTMVFTHGTKMGHTALANKMLTFLWILLNFIERFCGHLFFLICFSGYLRGIGEFSDQWLAQGGVPALIEAHWFQLFCAALAKHMQQCCQALENSQHTRDVINVQQIMGGQGNKHPINISSRRPHLTETCLDEGPA